MKMTLLSIGKFKSKPMQELAADYAERIGHYLPFEYVALKGEGKVLERLGQDDFLVVLDERGAHVTSKQLAEFLEEHQIRSTKRLTFFVGDARGVGSAVSQKADKLLALSKMTLPHEMAQVMLLEQLYRACTIIRGEKYHYE